MGRLPERDQRAIDERSGRFSWRPSNVTVALIFLIVLTVGPYLAFTKHVPFTSYGYQLNATFSNAVNVAKNSPVRIAGVDVGKVIGSEREGDKTTVTFTVEDKGRPIHDDASAAIRPRIFLEGNFFIDLDPGSPSAEEMDSDATIPVSRTSTAVQLDEIFTALQAPVRADLSTLLESYGRALNEEPTPEQDAAQLPEMRGKTGAQGLAGALFYGGPAGRFSAQVSDALLGTRPHDLSRLVASTGRFFEAFAHDEDDLRGLIENFEVFTGALAAQSDNLAATFEEFAPALDTARTTLVDVNRALPPLRAWAIEFRPAVAELPDLVEASKPWLAQARPLLSQREGGASARLLREATPGLAGSAQAGKAVALPQLNRLSLCTTGVLVPTFEQTINDRFTTGGPNYREFLYWLSAFASQGANFDGNGHFLRVQAGGGGNLVGLENPKGQLTTEKVAFAHTVQPPAGVQPRIGARPPKRPDVRCDRNPVPNLNGAAGQPGPPELTPRSIP